MFRHSHWMCCLCFGLLAPSVQAQSPNNSAKAIGELINVALQAVIPTEKRVENKSPVEEATADVIGRPIRLDYGRTLAAFRLPDNADTRAKLGLARTVTDGSAALLSGCDQEGMEACERLGRSAYVYVGAASISDSEAVVTVHVIWATTMPSNRTFESAVVTEVILTRSGSGPWTFLRFGKGVIS